LNVLWLTGGVTKKQEIPSNLISLHIALCMPEWGLNPADGGHNKV